MSKTFKELMEQAGKTAVAKGWWVQPKTFIECMAFAMGRVAKAIEYSREGHRLNRVWMEGEKPCGVAVEMADAIIYLMDTAHALQIPLADALERKLNYNDTIPYKAGRKGV